MFGELFEVDISRKTVDLVTFGQKKWAFGHFWSLKVGRKI